MKQAFKLEIKNLTEDGTFIGYGAIFNNTDSYNDVIVPGAFNKTIKKNPKEIKFLYQHKHDSPIGYFSSIEQDDIGLKIQGHFLTELEKGKEAYLLCKNNVLNSFSIGYSVKDFEIIDKKRYLKDIDVREISLVTFPANKDAIMLSFKSQKENNEIKVAPKNTEFKEKEEREHIESNLYCGSLEDLELDSNLVYCLKDDELLLNYNAVKNLPIEIKENYKNEVQLFYKAFRKEFKDYTLFSEVCNKSEVIETWDIKEYDKYLKSNGLSNSELKSFYKRLAEIKSKTIDNEESLKNNKLLEETIKGLEDLLN